MTCPKNKMNINYHVITVAATIFALAIIVVASSMGTSPIAATTTTPPTTSNNNTTAGTMPSSSGIELSPQPIYQERSPPGNITPINQTYISATHSGNGTLTLLNSTQTISTLSLIHIPSPRDRQKSRMPSSA